MKKVQKGYTVFVEGSFATDAQRAAFETRLHAVLKAVGDFCNAAHKGNGITIMFENETIVIPNVEMKNSIKKMLEATA